MKRTIATVIYPFALILSLPDMIIDPVKTKKVIWSSNRDPGAILLLSTPQENVTTNKAQCKRQITIN